MTMPDDNSTDPTASAACSTDDTSARIRPTPASRVSTRPSSRKTRDTNPATDKPATTAAVPGCLGNIPNAATSAAASNSARPINPTPSPVLAKKFSEFVAGSWPVTDACAYGITPKPKLSTPRTITPTVNTVDSPVTPERL